MIKKMSFFLFAAGLVTFSCSMLSAKAGDTWWYVHGEPYYWHYQTDVYAFRTADGKEWSESLDTGCVKFLYHRSMHHDKLNIIYFKAGCPDGGKEAVKEMIRISAWFGSEFPVITSYPDLPYSSAAWFVTDNLLLVNFNPDSLNERRFSKFKEKYGLKQINFPDSAIPGEIFTFIFEFDADKSEPGSAIDLARTIYEQDSGLVINVQPNLINAYEEVSDENNNVLDAGGDNFNEEDVEYYIISQNNRTVNLFVKYNGYVPVTVIKVYDLFGRELSSQKSKSKEIKQEIIISDYVGGIYFASIENERGKVLGVQKFVKL